MTRSIRTDSELDLALSKLSEKARSQGILVAAWEKSKRKRWNIEIDPGRIARKHAVAEKYARSIASAAHGINPTHRWNARLSPRRTSRREPIYR